MMFLLFFGCNEYNFAALKEENPGFEDSSGQLEEVLGPQIMVSPQFMDFGVNFYQTPPPLEVLTVSNMGNEELHIDSIDLGVSNGGFVFIGSDSVTLAPTQSLDFTVTMLTDIEGEFAGTINVTSDDPNDSLINVPLQGVVGQSQLAVSPSTYDFGTLDVGDTGQVPIQLTNAGSMDITVGELNFVSSSGELSFSADELTNGSLPWILSPGESKQVFVDYTPLDDMVDTSTLNVYHDAGQEIASQTGTAKEFEGFSTGWYVFDDGIPYETTSNPNYVINTHGDLDLYWYEPSGAHGLIDSTDPLADFALMRQYILDNAGPPIQVNGPFNFSETSTISTFSYATYTYFMCDFYLDPNIDVSRYAISGGNVDDGIQIMLNGEILGHRLLGEGTFSWPLQTANSGQVNTLIIILADDSASHKYANNLAFTLDGQMVE